VQQDPEAAELIKNHLLKYELHCPMCKSTSWEVGGPIGYTITDQVNPRPGELYRGPGRFDLVFMICTTCFYVRHFAWDRIKAQAEEAKRTVLVEKKDG
jgi:hypothetical protein